MIDRDKASQLGLKMSDIGAALGSMLGGGYVNYFALDGRSYKVIPQVQQAFRQNIDQILDYHIRAADGSSVPLSTVAKIVTKAIPQSLQPLPAAQQRHHPGRGLPRRVAGRGAADPAGAGGADAAAGLLDRLRRRLAPVHPGIGGFIVTFAFALIIIYLSLAALFESFRDPLIILFSVPMSIAGALVFLMALSTVGHSPAPRSTSTPRSGSSP